MQLVVEKKKQKTREYHSKPLLREETTRANESKAEKGSKDKNSNARNQTMD